MADRGDRLAGVGEVANHGQDFGVQAQVFRRAAARDDQCVVIFGAEVGEGRVQREVVTGFFAVGLVAFEVVDGGAHRFAGLFARAGGMDGVADHQQGLEGHHGFVVFGVVTGQHQDFAGSHVCLL